MLAELFMLKIEAIARTNSQQNGGTSSDSRFVPIKLSANTAKTSPTSSAKSA
jgi:hypothetical protein